MASGALRGAGFEDDLQLRSKSLRLGTCLVAWALRAFLAMRGAVPSSFWLVRQSLNTGDLNEVSSATKDTKQLSKCCL